MPLYLRICFDKAGSGDLRKEVLKTHREYIGAHIPGKNGIKVVQAGPMCVSDDTSVNCGSFLVLEAEALEDVQRFHNEDPFTRAQLFERADVVRWDRHVGNPDQAEYKP